MAVIGTWLAAGALMIPGAPHAPVVVNAQFAAPGAPGMAKAPNAVTYHKALVPVHSHVRVMERTSKRATRITLRLEGLRPARTYGAHVHTRPCGPAPADSGPHYQNVKDPQQPSTSPRYANPRNEVWLDVTTDRHGDGGATTRQAWRFRAGEARSLVVHERGTSTESGHAGEAGTRLACVNVPFR